MPLLGPSCLCFCVQARRRAQVIFVVLGLCVYIVIIVLETGTRLPSGTDERDRPKLGCSRCWRQVAMSEGRGQQHCELASQTPLSPHSTRTLYGSSSKQVVQFKAPTTRLHLLDRGTAVDGWQGTGHV
jgi:hypothetical protein